MLSPVQNFYCRKKILRLKILRFLFPVFAIFTLTAIQEIIERLFALYAEEAAGTAMPGFQGDIWDAQKNMLAGRIGCNKRDAAFCYRQQSFF